MIVNLIITIIIEALVMAGLTKSAEWCRYNLYCNLVTNPIINLFIRLWLYCYWLIVYGYVPYWGVVTANLGFIDYYLPFILGEAAVIFAEMFIYEIITKSNRKKCLLYSVITNGVSAIIGIIIMLVGDFN